MTENCCPWKSTSGFDGKRLFAHIVRTNRRIFEIQTAYVQVWSKWWWKNVVAENLLPVSTGKGFLLISWEPIDGFSKFKRHMLRFDRRHDMTFLILEIYFRCEQKNWKWALKHHFWTYSRSGLMEANTENCCRWKSTSGFDGKRLFAHILRTNWRIFEI